VRPELAVHLVEAPGEPPAKGILGIGKRRAEVADYAAALAHFAVADHFEGVQRVLCGRSRQPPGMA
jgi:hypothetical protein